MDAADNDAAIDYELIKDYMAASMELRNTPNNKQNIRQYVTLFKRYVNYITSLPDHQLHPAIDFAMEIRRQKEPYIQPN